MNTSAIEMYRLVDNTQYGLSMLSNTIVRKIQGDSGRYTCHLLNNLSASNQTILGIGMYSNTFLASLMVHASMNATFAMTMSSEYNSSQFTTVINAHKHPTSRYKCFEYADNDPFTKIIPSNQFDLIFLGTTASPLFLSKLVPYMKPKCVIVIDEFEQRGRNYIGELSTLPVSWIQDFRSSYGFEEAVNRQALRYNKGTWYEGILVAIVETEL